MPFPAMPWPGIVRSGLAAALVLLMVNAFLNVKDNMQNVEAHAEGTIIGGVRANSGRSRVHSGVLGEAANIC